MRASTLSFILLLFISFSKFDDVLAVVDLPSPPSLDRSDIYRQAYFNKEGQRAIPKIMPSQSESSFQDSQFILPDPETVSIEVEPQDSNILENISFHPAVYGMISQVETDTIYDLMERLTGIKPTLIGGEPYTILTRNTTSGIPLQMATQYVYEYFGDRGLDLQYHNWTTSGYSNRNVIGEIQGLGQPEKIVLITAHLDNMPSAIVAPGADDNASGVAGVMMAADILTKYRWDYTVRFVTFTGEEQGLLGSSAYAVKSYYLGEEIQGVLNMDMIGFNSDDNPTLDLYAWTAIPGSITIANLFTNVVTTYSIDLKPDVKIDQMLGNQSDNKSFWDHGYAAILAIENSADFTPYYHTAEDTLSTLDMDYFTNFVKAGVGTFAHMGGLLPTGWVEGTVTDVRTGEPLADVKVEATLSAGPTIAATIGEDGFFHLVLEPGIYSIKIDSEGYQPFNIEDLEVSNNETAKVVASLLPIEGLPLAGFSFRPEMPRVGESVVFTNTTVGTEPITYTWNFGGGMTSPEENPSHTYSEAGEYTVTLTAINDHGSNEASAHLIVDGIPLEASLYFPFVLRTP